MRREVPILFVIGSLLFLLGGCSDDDGGNNDNLNNQNNNQNVNENINNNDNQNDNENQNNNTVNDDTIYQVQDESDPHFIEEGQTVELEGVVVTAIDQFGEYTGDVYVQEPDGGPFSGVLCYKPSFVDTTLGDLAVGDRVDVTGTKSEYALSSDMSGRSLTEIINGTITFVEQGTPLQPEVVTSPQVVMNDPSAESYEGVLVTVENVRREGVNSYDSVLFTQNFVVGSDFMDCVAATVDDTCYSKVTGVLEYYMNYLVQPRTSDDIEVASDQGACDPTAPEICDDGEDNDEDGFTDCDDNDCATDPYCMETICDDGEDNDEDGFTDCEDEDCLFSGECRENDPTRCDDGLDNDGDGFTDCDDPSCLYHYDVAAAGLCHVETGDASCMDSIDNDGDAWTDCDDMGCYLSAIDTVCATALESSDTACNDGIDNDLNGHTDCDDFSCLYRGFCPGTETTDTLCADGIDNDGNGHTDCDDWSCQQSELVTVCEGSVYTCSDGIDNDGNGFVDCEDFACRSCNYGQWSVVCEPCP